MDSGFVLWRRLLPAKMFTYVALQWVVPFWPQPVLAIHREGENTHVSTKHNQPPCEPRIDEVTNGIQRGVQGFEWKKCYETGVDICTHMYTHTEHLAHFE